MYELCRERHYLVRELTWETYGEIISGVRLIQTEDFTLRDIEEVHAHFHQRLADLVRKRYSELTGTCPPAALYAWSRHEEGRSEEETMREVVMFGGCFA